jgi:hypothetical protein
MPTPVRELIRCPKCNQALPEGAPRCQFCGHTMTTTAPMSGRGVVILSGKNARKDHWSWKEWGYFIVSGLLIVLGAFYILMALHVIPSEDVEKLHFEAFLGLWGTFEIILGVGLIFEQTWAQFVMKWAAILNLLYSARNLLMGLMFGSVTMTLAAAVSICYLGLAIYFVNDMGDV